MPYGKLSARINSPNVGVFIDMGHPFLNQTVDGFLKIGTVGASRVFAEETYDSLAKGSITKHTLEHTAKKMGKEGLQWGVIGGIYTGIEYGIEKARGKRDWKNALMGGVLTGALATFGEDHYSKDKMMRNAITGGAIATASEFLRYLT
uniref:TSA: Wollemia nobilis Ref_Wollemi_Transcript_19984_829 transcribed RNA sequence n=1 Tax=Wollemia nobilis TaxID=56998 RepID=A0A0C9RHS9_9CONI